MNSHRIRTLVTSIVPWPDLKTPVNLNISTSRPHTDCGWRWLRPRHDPVFRCRRFRTDVDFQKTSVPVISVVHRYVWLLTQVECLQYPKTDHDPFGTSESGTYDRTSVPGTYRRITTQNKTVQTTIPDSFSEYE